MDKVKRHSTTTVLCLSKIVLTIETKCSMKSGGLSSAIIQPLLDAARRMICSAEDSITFWYSWVDKFGSDFYSHRLTSSSLESQSEDAWKLWMEGQLFETGEKLQVTKYDEMQRFIAEQLAPIKQLEGVNFDA